MRVGFSINDDERVEISVDDKIMLGDDDEAKICRSVEAWWLEHRNYRDRYHSDVRDVEHFCDGMRATVDGGQTPIRLFYAIRGPW